MNRKRKPLPPFARKFLETPPSAGLWIAIGPGAWRFAKKKSFPTLVLPQQNEPSDFRWPSHAGGALVFELGELNEERLEAIATELLVAGCPFVVAIREALMSEDPRHFFYVDSAA